MNAPLYLAMTEIKKIIASKEQIAHTPAKICPVCNTNPYSLNYPHEKTYICGDCYFDMLGDLVEAHPVGRP